MHTMIGLNIFYYQWWNEMWNCGYQIALYMYLHVFIWLSKNAIYVSTRHNLIIVFITIGFGDLFYNRSGTPYLAIKWYLFCKTEFKGAWLQGWLFYKHDFQTMNTTLPLKGHNLSIKWYLFRKTEWVAWQGQLNCFCKHIFQRMQFGPPPTALL